MTSTESIDEAIDEALQIVVEAGFRGAMLSLVIGASLNRLLNWSEANIGRKLDPALIDGMSRNTVEAGVQHLIEKAVEAFGVDVGHIRLTDTNRHKLVMVAGVGPCFAEALKVRALQARGGEVVAGRVAGLALPEGGAVMQGTLCKTWPRWNSTSSFICSIGRSGMRRKIPCQHWIIRLQSCLSGGNWKTACWTKQHSVR